MAASGLFRIVSSAAWARSRRRWCVLSPRRTSVWPSVLASARLAKLPGRGPSIPWFCPFCQL
eukprot:9925224-Prorocentrum_lima.AAC.1